MLSTKADEGYKSMIVKSPTSFSLSSGTLDRKDKLLFDLLLGDSFFSFLSMVNCRTFDELKLVLFDFNVVFELFFFIFCLVGFLSLCTETTFGPKHLVGLIVILLFTFEIFVFLGMLSRKDVRFPR
uniref:Transmembrane protein n=1 Tax=Euplotes harpa TaxID=151035 RepID=A0A7S3J2P4_9SPIT